MKRVVVASVVAIPIVLLGGCGLGTPSLPSEGIIAVAGGGEDTTTGDDRLAGDVDLGDGCTTIRQSDGTSVIGIFRSGAAEVDGDLTELEWKGKSYRDGASLSVEGVMFTSLNDLPAYTDYFIPGGCWQFENALLVNNLPPD